jgi:WhiB family redox-sensing transcriptional regulator
MDSAFFFHPDGERGPARARREARAKSICQSCPVLRLCREHALAVHEPYGIWGGMSESEREALIKRGKRELAVSTS